jgi:cell division protein FtsZ
MTFEIKEESIISPAVTHIKVIGVGGGGSNAVNGMIQAGLRDVQFIAVNTDLQDLQKAEVPDRVQLGARLTGGLGAGGKPEVGEKAALEDRERIQDCIRGADMIFITAGMGGGTGTGAAPIIAQVAREMQILTVGVVTKPFEFEREKRMRFADEGIMKLREAVDTLIVIPNENIFRVIDRKTPIKTAFKEADRVLRQAVQGISEMITREGDINIDFNDVKSIMSGQGDALMGIGIGQGENRAADAAKNAIDNKLLEDVSIEGSRGLLINVVGGSDFTLSEFQEINKAITAYADAEATVISGYRIDENLDDEIQVTVVATQRPRQREPEGEPAAAYKPDYIPYSLWDKKNNGKHGVKGGDYYAASDLFQTDDLGKPAVLRYVPPEPRADAKAGRGQWNVPGI